MMIDALKRGFLILDGSRKENGVQKADEKLKQIQ